MRERKKERTRAKLIDVAVRLCLEQGFDNTTVDQIAAAADVSSRTFSRYFPTKETVIVALGDDLDKVMASAISAQPTGACGFEMLARAHIEAFRPDGPYAPDAFNRMAIMIEIVNSSATLSATAFAVKDSVSENVALDVIAKRLGVPVDDQSVLLLANTWTAMFASSFAGLGMPGQDPIDAQVVCDRISENYAIFKRLCGQ